MNDKKSTKAWGLKKSKLGWQAVEYVIVDGKVILEKASPPDLRAIALEKFDAMTSGVLDEE